MLVAAYATCVCDQTSILVIILAFFNFEDVAPFARKLQQTIDAPRPRAMYIILSVHTAFAVGWFRRQAATKRNTKPWGLFAIWSSVVWYFWSGAHVVGCHARGDVADGRELFARNNGRRATTEGIYTPFGQHVAYVCKYAHAPEQAPFPISKFHFATTPTSK